MLQEQRKAVCDRLQVIETDLAIKAIDFYVREEYGRFTETISVLEKFLDVKKKICGGE